jgi:hypothetical protein
MQTVFSQLSVTIYPISISVDRETIYTIYTIQTVIRGQGQLKLEIKRGATHFVKGARAQIKQASHRKLVSLTKTSPSSSPSQDENTDSSASVVVGARDSLCPGRSRRTSCPT